MAYAAEFFRWFSEEAVRVEGGFGTLPDGRNRMLGRGPVNYRQSLVGSRTCVAAPPALDDGDRLA